MLRKQMTGWMLASALIPCALNAAEPATNAEQMSDTPAAHSELEPRRLDLRAPEIGRIFSLAEINAILSRAVDPALEYIEVEALRLGDLPLQDNSASAAESAIRTLVWLFAGSETLAAAVNRTPDATDSYRPEPFLQAHYHPSFDQP